MKKVYQLAAVGVVLASVFLISKKANAEQTLGLHLASIHSNNKSDWNNHNPGIYYRYNNWVIGTYKNSVRKDSYYGGYVYGITPYLDCVVGVISGYDNGKGNNRLMPMLVPSVHLPLDERTHVRIHFVPKVNKHGAAALHLSIEQRF